MSDAIVNVLTRIAEAMEQNNRLIQENIDTNERLAQENQEMQRVLYSALLRKDFVRIVQQIDGPNVVQMGAEEIRRYADEFARAGNLFESTFKAVRDLGVWPKEEK